MAGAMCGGCDGRLLADERGCRFAIGGARRAERLTGTSAAVVYYLAGSRGRAVPAREPAPSESAIF